MVSSLEQKVLGEAVEFFMKYGVKSVSMDDISRKLGISKKTLYTVVESKADLLKNSLLHHLEHEKSFVINARNEASDAVEEMVTVSKFIISILRKHKPSLVYEVQKYYPEVWQLIEEFNNGFILSFVLDNIHRGQKEVLYRQDLDPIVISRLYASRLPVLVDQSLFPVDQFPRADLYEQFITHHMRGMMTKKGIKRFEKILEQ